MGNVNVGCHHRDYAVHQMRSRCNYQPLPKSPRQGDDVSVALVHIDEEAFTDPGQATLYIWVPRGAVTRLDAAFRERLTSAIFDAMLDQDRDEMSPQPIADVVLALFKGDA